MRNITLKTLRDWDACSKGYDRITKHVGENEVIDLNLALEVMSIPDVVWALSHDPDKHRWLSFLADMIDLPGCEVIVQAVRDYRDGTIPSTDLETVATDALITAITHVTARAADYAATRAARNTATVYAAARAARAAPADPRAADYAARAADYAARAAISIGGKPRLIKLIRRYYQ